MTERERRRGRWWERERYRGVGRQWVPEKRKEREMVGKRV